MSKCLVGFCHLMGIFTLLASAAHIVGGIDDLTSQLFLHGALTAGSCISCQPAQTQGLTSLRTYFHGNLVSSTTYTAGLNFQYGHDVLQSLLENIQRLLTCLFADNVECAVNNLLSDTLLTVQHNAVYQTGNELGIVQGIYQYIALSNLTSSWHFASLLHIMISLVLVSLKTPVS